jgi:hypothetical protein
LGKLSQRVKWPVGVEKLCDWNDLVGGWSTAMVVSQELVYPWVWRYPFCITLSGLFYPRNMNQDSAEQITAKGLPA